MDGSEWIAARIQRMTDLFPQSSLAVDFPLLKGVPIPAATMTELQETALRFMASSLSAYAECDSVDPLPKMLRDRRSDLEALPNKTPNGVIRSYTENVNEFRSFVDCLYRFLLSINLAANVSEVQIPPNLRLVAGASPGEQGSRPYATDKLHTDVWAGEPLFSLNILIPLLGDLDAINVRFCQPHTVPVSLRRPLVDYSAAESESVGLINYDVELQNGVAYFFDTFLFHQTIRYRDGLRLSVDLRGLFRSRFLDEESPWVYPSRFMRVDRLGQSVPIDLLARESFFETPYRSQ
jgi:hypothetical protein